MAKERKMLKVVVDRRRWHRGQGTDGSALYVERNRKMCCLGFACRSAGYKVREIRGIPDPSELDRPVPSIEPLVADKGIRSSVCESLIDTNDNELMDDGTREARLKQLGLSAGIEFSFIN